MNHCPPWRRKLSYLFKYRRLVLTCNNRVMITSLDGWSRFLSSWDYEVSNGGFCFWGTAGYVADQSWFWFFLWVYHDSFLTKLKSNWLFWWLKSIWRDDFRLRSNDSFLSMAWLEIEDVIIKFSKWDLWLWSQGLVLFRKLGILG